MLAPLVALLRRARLGRVPAVLLAVVVALGIIAALGSVIGTRVAQLAANALQYAATIEQKAQVVRAYTVGWLSNLTAGMGRGAMAPQQTAAAPASPAGSPLALAERYLSPILSPLATTGIVLVVAIFILLQQEDLRDQPVRLFGSSDLHRTTVAMDDAARRLSKYFLTQLAINATFGLVIGIGLYAIGVPSPVLWGVLSALLRFVPYVRLLYLRRAAHCACGRRGPRVGHRDLDGGALPCR